MHLSTSLRIAVAAVLVGSSAVAEESRLEEIVVTSTPLRENPLEVAQPTTVVAGDDLRRQISTSIGETLSHELGVSSTYFGPSASRPVIRGLGGYRVQTLQDGLASLDVAGLSQDHAVTVESVVSHHHPLRLLTRPFSPMTAVFAATSWSGNRSLAETAVPIVYESPSAT
jgi:iron complex outermembrane receptor protein